MSNSDWWTTGNQILVSVLAVPFVFIDYLQPSDFSALSQTSTSRHTDCKVILRCLKNELAIRRALSASINNSA